MKLGIKYCGGCNPRYDRSYQVKELLKNIPDVDPVYDTSVYCPVWIVVCGCPNSCVNADSLRAGKVLKAVSVKDFVWLKTELSNYSDGPDKPDRRILATGMTASRSRTFTDKDLFAFAALSQDRNGVHLDPAIADLTIFRKPVVHGIFVSSLFSAILGTELPGSGTILTEEAVKYMAPVFPGDTVTAEIRFLSYTEHGSAYIGEFEGSCRKADDTEVARGRFWELMSKQFFLIEKE